MSIAADISAVLARIDQIDGERRPATSALAGGPVRARRPSGGAGAFGSLVAREYESLARREGRVAGVDPALVAAVARVESGFDPHATSGVGAAGLMQLMPATAADLGVADPYDPVQNVRGGAAYLHRLLERFAGDVPLAVAAYNAGPGAVERYGGIPPFPETRAYVERVMAAYRDGLAR